MVNGELSPEFLNPLAPGIIEFSSPIIWLVLFIYCWRASKRAGTLTFGMLLLLSTTSMFWLEFYADWGAYLLYNPNFKLIPWGTTWWTTPNKPWFMPFSYGWFYYGAMMLMFALIARVRRSQPEWGLVKSVIVVSAPFFYLWDFVLEFTAAMTGWWSYVYYMGPAAVSKMGNFPFLHPIGMYTVSGVILCLVLSHRRDDGRAAFESWSGADRMDKGFLREAARLGTWVVVMNLLYIVSFVVPLNLVREIFGVPNLVVP